MRVRIDEGTADRLLSGSVPPDDAPPGFGGVAAAVLRVRNGVSEVAPGGRFSVRPVARRGRRLVTAAAAVAMLSTAGVGAARTFTPTPVPAPPPAPAPVDEPLDTVVDVAPVAERVVVTSTSSTSTTAPLAPADQPDASAWVGLDAAPDPTVVDISTTTTAPPPDEPAPGADEEERGEKGKRRAGK